MTVDGYHEEISLGVKVNINFFVFINAVNHQYFETGNTCSRKSVAMSVYTQMSRKGRNGDYIWEHEK